MPVTIRRFHIQKINEYVKKREEEMEAEAGIQRLTPGNNPMGNTNKPGKPIEKKPTYSSTIKPKK